MLRKHRGGVTTKTRGSRGGFLEEGTPVLCLKDRREVNQMKWEERVFQADRMSIRVHAQK